MLLLFFILLKHGYIKKKTVREVNYKTLIRYVAMNESTLYKTN